MPTPEAKNPKQEYSTSDFEGVNTQALRQAIKKGQQAWLENIQPIGPANAKTVPALSSVLLQLSGAVTPYYAQGLNILLAAVSTDIVIVASTDGNVWSINLFTNTLTPISFGTAYAGKFLKTAAAQWKNERILFIDSTNGLYDWDGTTLTWSQAGASGYTGPFPTTGQCIASFSGSVWVSNNRTVYYSATSSYNNWTGVSFSGSFVITDETLHSSVQQMVSSSNFLYIFGVDSCNTVSDVNLAASIQMVNTNLSTGVGTPHHASVATYYRSIWFASSTGFYAMYGAAARKESFELDGMFSLISGLNTPAAIGAQPTISSGLVSINNILCVAFLFVYQDPDVGNRPLLAINFDKKWFFCNQGAISGVTSPTLIASANLRGKTNLYCFDSTGNFYQMFSNATSPVSFIWKTALWDMEQSVKYKQITKAGIGASFTDSTGSVNVAADSEISSNLYNFNTSRNLSFTGSGPIVFSGIGDISWVLNGYSLMQSDVSNFGRYVGLTITGSSISTTFTLAMIEYNLRSQWGT